MICRPKSCLSPTLVSGNSQRSCPSHSTTPSSSFGPIASSTPMAHWRATWLPLLNSIPCITKTSAPGGSTFLLLNSMLTGSALSSGVLR